MPRITESNRWLAFALVAALQAVSVGGAAAAGADAAPSDVSSSAGPFSLDLDYLIWSVSGDKLPALVSTGIPGAPGTQILYGASTVDDDWRSGGQLTAGYRFDPEHNAGVELSFFDLGDASSQFSANSSAYPTLALPFNDATTGTPNTLLAGAPGFISGAVTASDTSRFLGLRALYRRELGAMGKEDFSALVGYRYLYESDQLDIASSALALSGSTAGAFVAERNSFGATNAFDGLDLGVAGDAAEGPWRIGWRAHLAVGADIDGARIDGATTVSAGGTTTSFPGGLYALSSNIGDRTQARFGVVPEFALKAGYEIAASWQVFAGYDLIYWTGVQRAGNLIDTTINPSLLPPVTAGGPQRPAARFDTTALLAQGFNLGIKHEF